MCGAACEWTYSWWKLNCDPRTYGSRKKESREKKLKNLFLCCILCYRYREEKGTGNRKWKNKKRLWTRIFCVQKAFLKLGINVDGAKHVIDTLFIRERLGWWILIAERLSQKMIADCEKGKWRSYMRLPSHWILRIVWARVRYSALEELHETMICFFNFYENGESPINYVASGGFARVRTTNPIRITISL